MANNGNLPSRDMKFRTKILMTAAFFMLFVFVIGNFFKISVLENRKYQAMANDQHFGSITVKAHRGSIYDSQGIALARSASVYKVFLDPAKFKEEMEELQKRIDKRAEDIKKGTYEPKIEPVTNEEGVQTGERDAKELPVSASAFREQAISVLSEKLGISAEKVVNAMEADNQYSVLQERVEKPVADEVLGLFTQYDLICLNVEEDTKRYYPQNECAASVIGFTAADGYGLYGIESYYDEYLSGTDGRTISAKDSHGNELPYRYSKTYAPQNGNDIYLTLDSNIQHYLEKHLQEMSEEFLIKNRSCAILMNAKTGAIYGMAQYPSYDLNNPYDIVEPYIAEQLKKLDGDEFNKLQGFGRETQWRNKCISELYEPGSVFKVITSSGAFEENVINYDRDSFYCAGFLKLDGHPEPVNCDQIGGHGAQSYQDALTHSCNPAFMLIGMQLGKEKFCYYYDSFGLRERTGIDLPAESAGINQDVDSMTNVDLAMSSIGQNETITPLEMITSYCAAINGGYLLRPYIVDKILDEDGNVVLKNERTVRRQVISNETSDLMRNALYNVATASSGGNVTIKGYAIGGKSGTSERLSEVNRESMVANGTKLNKKQEENGASYCCFAPADDPEVILLVLADMPDRVNNGNQYYGGTVAVPTARNILTDVLPYLGISPEYSDSELAELDIRIPLLEGNIEAAKATLESLGANYQVIGEGNSVVKQSPETGSSIAKGGTVYLYTEENHPFDTTEVPDLVGLSPEYANDSIVYKHLNYVATGASIHREGAVVKSQSVEPGTKVPWGTTIELEFQVTDGGD